MSAPATRQRLLRQVLIAVLDAPAPREIRFENGDERHRVTIECDSADAAAALVKALHLRDRSEFGMPTPLAGVPRCSTGWLDGTLHGWKFSLCFEAPFTGQYVDQWEAERGFELYGTARPEPTLAVTT